MCSDPQLLAYYKACFFLHRRHLFICKRGEEEQGERVQAENIQKFQEKSRGRIRKKRRRREANKREGSTLLSAGDHVTGGVRNRQLHLIFCQSLSLAGIGTFHYQPGRDYDQRSVLENT